MKHDVCILSDLANNKFLLSLLVLILNYLLEEIPTTKLLACDMNEAVFAVAKEDAPLDRTNHECAILALIDRHLKFQSKSQKSIKNRKNSAKKEGSKPT